jgi:hypothetical protein
VYFFVGYCSKGNVVVLADRRLALELLPRYT